MEQSNNLGSKISYPITLEGLSGKSFRIPIYQRKYAWEDTEVVQLLNDLKDANQERQHFIGNIVVERTGVENYDVIDGQQRLTTLYLIGLLTGYDKLFELTYEVRENDRDFLSALKKQADQIDKGLLTKSKDSRSADKQLIANITAILDWLSETDSTDVLTKAKLAFTELIPNEVDIAKYFEVMNSRGKQLEPHQVLKAKFLEKIKEPKEQAIYSRLWDYCSQMDVYIEDFIYQYEVREYDKKSKQSKPTIGTEKLRKDLIDFALNKTDKPISLEFFKGESNGASNKEQTIWDFIKSSDKPDSNGEKEFKGVNCYRSFLKFEYFLLHVLHHYLSKRSEGTLDKKEFVFKDTKLIDQFDRLFFTDDAGDDTRELDAKEFLEELFRYRILFDYFVFKRDLETDEPFFACLSKKRDNDNNGDDGLSIDRATTSIEARQIMNLQLLFNFTGDFYAQHWVQNVFQWLDNQTSQDVSSSDFYKGYINFLEAFDHRVMLTRINGGDLQSVYLCYPPDNETDSLSSSEIRKEINAHCHKGTSTAHYWFYRLDYILWRDYDWKSHKFDNLFDKDANLKDIFRLSRLNSIEHFKPQSQKEDWSQVERCGDCPHKGEKSVDCFGNLALISQHMNSTLSDENKENKVLFIQRQLNRGTIESLKMLVFYSGLEKGRDITPEYCQKHQEEMINYFCGC